MRAFILLAIVAVLIEPRYSTGDLATQMIKWIVGVVLFLLIPWANDKDIQHDSDATVPNGKDREGPDETEPR